MLSYIGLTLGVDQESSDGKCKNHLQYWSRITLLRRKTGHVSVQNDEELQQNKKTFELVKTVN